MVRNVNYKIAICDDDREQLTKLEALVTNWTGESGHVCNIRTFTSAEEFLFEYDDDKAYSFVNGVLNAIAKELSRKE